LRNGRGNVTPIDGANLNPIEDTVSLNPDTSAVIKIHGAREFQHKWDYIYIYIAFNFLQTKTNESAVVPPILYKGYSLNDLEFGK
jgi:hypothetical protein